MSQSKVTGKSSATYHMNNAELKQHPLQTALAQHEKMEQQRTRVLPSAIFGSSLMTELAFTEQIVGSRLRLPGLEESFSARDLLDVNGESRLGYEHWMEEMRMGGEEQTTDTHSHVAKLMGLQQ
mmetsp:Transcript_3162/g.12117  ORF Transcript_3162/g.12117 Transcript_3162/m.12117 type:complete len:124 (-) Transcript_3162:65-436(-)|eukprot:CAMPEP_0117445250 /NCGR_PEP_ID=MMETSP0759-20121206/5691_1 /TAXON_ID=63605 /ORGANISM="Percolomonas cosmopolitus, Strain WS" /LENGTH=123 /DNA_ID=CAMNT_0005237405 /DNA_START=24 /DNA_END=395 /DNA_ORIENTATION=+